jgi:hypothetical protein
MTLCQFPQPANSRKHIAARNYRTLSSGKCGYNIRHEYEWAFFYQFFEAGPYRNGLMDKPHIFSQATETCLLQFKEQVPIKFKNKKSAVQCKILIQISTSVNSRWNIIVLPET